MSKSEIKTMTLSTIDITLSGSILNKCPDNKNCTYNFNTIVSIICRTNNILNADPFEVFKIVMSNSTMRNEWIAHKWDIEYIELNMSLVKEFYEKKNIIASLPLVQNWIINQKMIQIIWNHIYFKGNKISEKDIINRIGLFTKKCIKFPQIKNTNFKEFEIIQMPPKLESCRFPHRPIPRFVSSFLNKKIWENFLTNLDIKIVSSTSLFKVLSGVASNKKKDKWELEKINGIIYVNHIPGRKTNDIHSIGHIVEKNVCTYHSTSKNQSIFNVCVNTICGINCVTTSEIDCFDNKGDPIEIKSSILDEKPNLKDIVQVSINRSKKICKFLRKDNKIVSKKIYDSQKLRDDCIRWQSIGQRVKYMIDIITAIDFSKGSYTLRFDDNKFPIISQLVGFKYSKIVLRKLEQKMKNPLNSKFNKLSL